MTEPGKYKYLKAIWRNVELGALLSLPAVVVGMAAYELVKFIKKDEGKDRG